MKTRIYAAPAAKGLKQLFQPLLYVYDYSYVSNACELGFIVIIIISSLSLYDVKTIFNPLSPHDALKHYLASLKIDLISYH